MHARFRRTLQIENRLLQKKVTAVGRYGIFALFTREYLRGAFWHYRLKTWLDCTDLAEFLIFFQERPSIR